MKSDQVKGYQLGAIDYLIKPFDPEILLLKIQALLRQISVEAPSAVAYQIGNFTFQPSQRALSHADKLWQLSPKESELLHLLCNKQSEVLTRTEALVKIWGEDSFFTAQSMNVYVSRLRKYFRTDADHPVRIDNLHSKGFRLQPSAQALEY